VYVPVICSAADDPVNCVCVCACVQVVCMVRTAMSERGYEEHYSSSCSTRETCEAACAAVNGGTTSASSGALSSCSCVPPTYVQRTCFPASYLHLDVFIQ